MRSGHAGDARGGVLLSRTEAVAEAHSAHAQLFDLCEYLVDRDRLCQHMSAGTLQLLDTFLFDVIPTRAVDHGCHHAVTEKLPCCNGLAADL